MGSISLQSTQVTAKNSIKVKSPCFFGTATEAVVALGGKGAVGVATLSTCAVLTVATAGVDGEHAVPKRINIKVKGMNFRDMEGYR